MENLSLIIENIDQLTYSLNKLRAQVLELSATKEKISTLSRLQKEELTRLLNSPSWPEAINLENLCLSEEDKKDRALGILHMLNIFDIDPRRKKLLDYGCGEGHLSQAASEIASLSIGYDLSMDWQQVEAKKPFDIVVLYDVLDHAEKESPVDILKKIKSVIHKESLVFIHFHPWCGKHGAHLYRELNKAYVQLFFTKEELQTMGCSPIQTTEIIYPIRTYKQWIKDAGFTIIEHEIHRTPVPDFFRQEPLMGILENIWGPRFTLEQMGVEFADVVIKLSEQS